MRRPCLKTPPGFERLRRRLAALMLRPRSVMRTEPGDPTIAAAAPRPGPPTVPSRLSGARPLEPSRSSHPAPPSFSQ